jgi:hypothetical protein
MRERGDTRRGGLGEERAAPPQLDSEAVKESPEMRERGDTRRGGLGEERAAPPQLD